MKSSVLLRFSMKGLEGEDARGWCVAAGGGQIAVQKPQ